MKYVLPHVHAAICAVLLLSAACGDTSSESELTNADTYINKGVAYYEQGEHRRAIENFDRAIELDPTDALTYDNRGYTYYELGEYGLAIEDYDKAIELDPTSTVSRYI